mgnify:CR=1 FL=1
MSKYVIIEPGSRLLTLTPSDSQEISQTTSGAIPYARKLRVTATGDVALVTIGGDNRTYTALAAGTIIDWVAVKQVKSTGTTATVEAIY